MDVSETLRPALAPLALAGLLAAGLWLGTGTIPSSSALENEPPGPVLDFFAYYRPNAEYLGARLRAGDVPLWSPHQALGGPFLATLQPGVLYPPNGLHAFFPAQASFVALAALHLALAAILAGGFARALGAGAIGGAAAGLLYAMSVQLEGSIWTPPTLYSAAWAPAVLWAVDRLATRSGPSLAHGTLALAGAVAMQALTGWPLALTMTASAAALYGAAVLAGQALRERRLPLASSAALVAGALLGAMLAAPLLLPAAEVLAHSCRALGSLDATKAIFISGPHDPTSFASNLLARGANDGVPGLLALPLAVIGAILPGPGRGRAAILLGLAALALLISFADHTPVYAWVRELPLLGDFRFPFRYRLVSTLALAVAAGVGVGRIAASPGLPRRIAFAAAASAAALAVGLQGVASARGRLAFPRASADLPASAGRRAEAWLRTAQPDLSRVLWQERSDRLGGPSRLYVVNDLEPMTLARTAEILSYFEFGRPMTEEPARAAGGSAPKTLKGVAPFVGRIGVPADGAQARILDLLSVRSVVTDRKPPAWLAGRDPVVAEFGGFVRIFENAAAFPRAYRVQAGEAEPPVLEEALARLVSGDFDPRAVALLDPLPAELAAPAGVAEATEADVLVEVFEPERVVLRTTGNAPGAVVLTDAWFPGWEARVDGAPAPLLRANTALRAVAVAPGEHRVELLYRPASFRRGLALFGIAAVGCAGIGVAGLRRAPGAGARKA